MANYNQIRRSLSLKRFKDKFTTFILTALKILIAIVLYTSRDTISKIIKGFSFNIACVLIIFVIGIFSLYKIINSNINIKNQVILILLCAFALRALWLLNINSIPVSDFKVIYESAEYFLKGDRSMFWGTSYMARFPHLTIMVLYMALMIKLFPIHNLLIMKMVNLSLGVLSVFLIYLIVKKIFNSEKKGLIAAALASVFPIQPYFAQKI